MPDGPPGLALLTALALATVVAAMVLYRRLSRDDLLDSEIRQRLLALVRDRPGVHASELADELDVAVTTVLYHARVMAEYDLLTLRREGRTVAFFDPSRHDAFEQRCRAVLGDGPKRALVQTVHREPGIRMAELARRMDRTASTIKYHVDKLVDDGLLREDRSDGGRRFEVPDRVASAIDERGG